MSDNQRYARNTFFLKFLNEERGKRKARCIHSAHHAIAKSIVLETACWKYLNDVEDGRTYVPIPLLYQVFWLFSTSFKMRLYSSITFVFFEESQQVMPLDSLPNAYLLSELIWGTVDANDEVSTNDLMPTWSEFCVRGSPKIRCRLPKKARVVRQRTDADELVLTALAFNRGYRIVWHGR